MRKGKFLEPFSVIAFTGILLITFHAPLADSVFRLGMRVENQEKARALSGALFYVSRAFKSDSPDTHYRLGKEFWERRKFQLAKDEYQRALKLDPKYPRAHLEIGGLYFISPEVVPLEEAFESFSREIAISNHPYAYHSRGILFGLLNKLEMAESDFRNEMALWDSWGAPLNLAWVLSSQGKLEEAEKVMQVVKERAPGSVWAQNGLGVIYLNQGRFRESTDELYTAFSQAEVLTVEEYREAYPGNDPRNALEEIENIKTGIAFNLGVAFEKQGKTPQALAWYIKAHDLMDGRSHVDIAEGVTETSLQAKITALTQLIK